MTVTETDFERTVRAIRKRNEEEHTGFWFNLIRYRDCRFLQGSVIEENAPRGLFRNIAFLWEHTAPGDLDGFWPEISGRPVTPSEESFLVEYLSTRHPGEVELIVPERNIARPVDWDIFENSREYPIYRDRIYPEVMRVIEETGFPDSSAPGRIGGEPRKTERPGQDPEKRLLDLGCGSGNLIATLLDHFAKKDTRRDGGKGTGKRGIPPFQCYGVDISNENVEAARGKGLNGIFTGDCEEIDKVLPPELTFDLMLFCGLLNRQVVPSREKALSILTNALKRLLPGGHVVITGFSSCHLTAEDLARGGIEVLRTSLPGNLFKSYDDYFLRQLYLGRKM